MPGTDLAARDAEPVMPSPVVALGTIVPGATAGDGVHWSLTGERDLDVNLVHLDPGSRVDAHTNAEVDVVIVVVAGSGALYVDDADHELVANVLAFVAKGTRRSVLAGSEGLDYVTVHRRRGAMGIGRAPRAATT